MNARAELIERVALRRRDQLGPLSDGAYQELLDDVKADVERFVETPSEEAMLLVCKALERHEEARKDEDLMDDDAFFSSRAKRMARLGHDCEAALALDPSCFDAALLSTLSKDLDPDRAIRPLLELEHRAVETLAQGVLPSDAWNDLTLRPLLRIKAAVARTCLDSSRYRMAAEKAEEAIALSSSDVIGVRHTCALAYARLEDENAFDALDVLFSRQGSTWEHLARTILLYKLGRMSAARRALRGFSRLCEGGAYALIKPVMVDTYLPDRPDAPVLSFAEATLAVHEADPIICDVPDFVAWAQGQRDTFFAAQDFARRNGYDW